MSVAQCRCPECQTVLKLKALPEGKSVTCPDCGAKFRPAKAAKRPADRDDKEERVSRKTQARREPEDDDEPRRRKSKKGRPAKRDSGNPLLVVGLVAAGVLLIVGVSIGLYFALRPTDESPPVVQNPPPPGALGNPMMMPGGRGNPVVPPGGQGNVNLPPIGPGNPNVPPGNQDNPNGPQKPIDQVRAPVADEPPPEIPPLPPPGQRPFLVLDPGGHTDGIMGVAMTPDGQRVITAALDKTVRVWDATTGETLSVFHPPVGPGVEGTLNAVAVSPNGLTLAVAGAPIAGGKFGVPIYILSLGDGQVERVLKGHPGNIVSLDYSADGTRLLSGATDGTARIWDLGTGKTLLELRGHGERVRQARFSPDGKRVAATGTDGNLRIWSAERATPPLVIPAHKARVAAVAWSHDGKQVASGAEDGTLRLWTAAGAAIRGVDYPVKVTPFMFTSLTFTPDDRELLYTGVQEVGQVGLLDVTTLKPRLTFDKHDNTVMQAAISRDGSVVATVGGSSNPVMIWRTRDGSVIHTLQGSGRSLFALGWGADGKSIAWGNTNGPGVLRHGKPLERTFRLAELDFGDAPAANVVKPLVSSGEWAVELADLYRVNVKRGVKVIATIRCPHDHEQVYSGTLLPGSSFFAFGGQYGVYGIDLNDPRKLREFTNGHTANVSAAAPSPDGRYFVTGAMDQTMRIWRRDRDEPLLSLFVAGSEWIAWTPEGYYAASPNGERLMGWQINNGPDQTGSYYPAIQFHASLYQPEVIRRLLSAGSLPNAIAQVMRERKRPVATVNMTQVLPPSVAIATPTRVPGGFKVAGKTVEVRAKARSAGTNPVTALRLMLDGRPYQGQAGLRLIEQPKLGDVEMVWTVEVPPGWHFVAVQAESAVSKGMSAPIELVTPDTGELPSLYMVAVGISAYPGKMRLHFAASDALLLKSVFEDRARSAFKIVEVHLIVDRDATRARIVKELDWLKTVMTPRDVAIFSFSGHGARDEEDNFYLVPVDANPRDIAHTLLPGEVLSRHLAALPGKVVALLDACHSGSVAEDMQISRPDNLARDLVSDETGVVVMCSSLGSEYSLESSATKAGFFTLGIAEGLAGAADLNKDGVVYIHELDYYAGMRVRALSGGKQHTTTGRPPSIRPFPLARTGK